MSEGNGDAVTRRLPDLAAGAPEDFALRVLRRAGLSREHYDTYVRLDTAAGGLFVAASPQTVTGACLDSAGLTATGFEELHRARTGRSAIPGGRPLPGLLPALRTGRARRLAIDLSGLPEGQRAILEAVRSIPPGQLRPLSWIAREADAGSPPPVSDVLGALTANPVAVLIPCHRVTHDNGSPCDAAYLPKAGEALRRAEHIDMRRVAELSRAGAVFLGSDTTFIYCHPTCAHARRITPGHRVHFPTARDAREAGYRACKSCRPLTV
ncbi:MGMT family protein [Streptomyces prasinopilosus]|uniref:O6-methylguanine-DNA--protein-cysteine methyltransferase n=1 Tax=Streptomyces prasinopilosus TaxID=67344 RepID=A0A1G6LBR7_9ACTN|nr:MGMT family protein [Streptomyces prasinopilosus]SDC40457.1 O6-methylguanine-DNA--protein-cysteine methyltransferase [Streptomyces prasinopilosus]